MAIGRLAHRCRLMLWLLLPFLQLTFLWAENIFIAVGYGIRTEGPMSSSQIEKGAIPEKRMSCEGAACGLKPKRARRAGNALSATWPMATKPKARAAKQKKQAETIQQKHDNPHASHGKGTTWRPKGGVAGNASCHCCVACAHRSCAGTISANRNSRQAKRDQASERLRIAPPSIKVYTRRCANCVLDSSLYVAPRDRRGQAPQTQVCRRCELRPITRGQLEQRAKRKKQIIGHYNAAKPARGLCKTKLT